MENALACENIRFSSLFADGDVSRETSPAAKSEEKLMFSQAKNAWEISWFELTNQKPGSLLRSKWARNPNFPLLVYFQQVPIDNALLAGSQQNANKTP